MHRAFGGDVERFCHSVALVMDVSVGGDIGVTSYCHQARVISSPTARSYMYRA